MDSLPEGDVHLWLCAPDDARDPALLARYRELCTPDERAREDTFLFEHDRHAYRVARALLRTVLAGYLGTSPSALAFSRGAHGRPELEGRGTPPLRFNLSHAPGLAVLAVTAAGELGVDVEDVERPGEWVGGASSFFAPAEVSALARVPAPRRRERFFELWTLKEAYLKARGTGLALPLDGFAFEMDGPGALGFTAPPDIDPAPGAWSFVLLAPGPRHRAAVALRHPGGAPRLRCFRTLPLVRNEPAECEILARS
jgi:4'-phosphopantetheinyl transferase